MNIFQHKKRWLALALALSMALASGGCTPAENPASQVSGTSSVEAPKGEFNPYSFNLKYTMPGEGGVVFQNEEAQLSLEINNIGSYQVKEGVVTFTITSVYGGEPEVVTKTFEGTDDTLTVLNVPVETSVLGYWSVDADIQIDGNKLDTISKGYCVVNKPQEYGQFAKDGFFGAMGAVEGAPVERIGMRYDRPCAYWRFIRGADGRNHWEGLDGLIDELYSHNIQIVLCVQPEVELSGVTIAGLEIETTEDLIRPDVLEEYEKFLRELVQRYKDKVIAIEIINEPDINFILTSKVSPEKTAEIVSKVMSLSYRVIKEEAPDMPVAGLSLSEREYFAAPEGQKSYADYIFDEAKGAKLADIASLHPYPTKWDIATQQKRYTSPEEFGLSRYISEGIRYLKANGIDRFYVTEIGYSVYATEPLLSSNRVLQAALLARSLITCRSFPELEMALQFSANYGDEDGSCMGMFGPKIKEGNFYPFICAATFSQTAYVLYGKEPQKTISNGEGTGISAYQFSSDDETVVAIWKNRTTQSVEISGVSSLQVQDMFGNTIANGDVTIAIGDNPLYLIADAAQSEALVSAVEAMLQ